MYKQALMLLFVAIFLFSCQPAGKEDFKNFSAEYKNITQKLAEQKNKVKTRDQYIAYKEESKNEYDSLLEKYAKSPSTGEIEILRSKVLLKLKKLDEAEKKIDNIITEKPELKDKAQVIKVQILIEKEKYGDAYEIFKHVEDKMERSDELFNIYYYLAIEHESNKVKEEYCTKFLEAKDLPESQKANRYEVYSTLATVAAISGDFEKSRQILKKGIDEIKEARQRVVLEKQTGQLDFIGSPAFPLTASTWVNSSPVDLKSLKGKAVVVFFWAPWCPYCRAISPTLLEEYNKNAEKGLVIIGLTRLYGKYRDDKIDKGTVNKEEEIGYIKEYLDRNNIRYPVVVADDKADFETYKISGLPTMVFIDQNGNFDFIKIGGGDSHFIRDKIKSLL